jgi:hypothetical protein
MDPARLSHNPPGRRSPSRRHGRSSPDDSPTRTLATPGPYQSQTSLPSIRQLHPYLPPAGMGPIPSGVGDGPSYSYPPPPHPSMIGSSSVHSGRQDQPPALTMREPDSFAGEESSPEGSPDQQGPPKKKRRRQALSCTGARFYHRINYTILLTLLLLPLSF